MILVSFSKNTTAATNRTETVYTSRAPKFTPDFFSGDRVVQTLVFCVVLCKSLGVVFFSFGHCIFWHSSIYIFWLPFGTSKLYFHYMFQTKSTIHYSDNNKNFVIWIIWLSYRWKYCNSHFNLIHAARNGTNATCLLQR